LPPFPPNFYFSSSSSVRETCLGFSPTDTSISAFPILILSFIFARDYIGGVVVLLLLLSFGLFSKPLLGVVADEFTLQVYSSFAKKAGVDLSRAAKSSFMILLVGMLGVSFSNPPWQKIIDSWVHTVCLNL
jgi:hypothetical protein